MNYYDSQRFGVPGGPYNTHLIGKAVVEGDWREAWRQMRVSGNKKDGDLSFLKSKNPSREEYRKFFLTVNPKKVRFFVSAYNSYLWNSRVSSEISRISKSGKIEIDHIGDLRIPLVSDARIPVTISVRGYEINNNLLACRADNSRPAMVTSAVFAGTAVKDEMHPGKKKITLSFFLPTGSYATMCVHQLLCKLSFK